MRRNEAIQEVLTHWSYLARGLQYDPETFYGTLEGKFNAENIEGLLISRATMNQKGMFSRKRIYLRVTYYNLMFDICGAPFGESNFFFSYWMGVKNRSGCLAIILPLLLSIPLLGAIIEKNLDSLTYFEQDTATMFDSLISQLVIGEVDRIMEEVDIEPIPESARVPDDKKLTKI